jgi:hypothetical protein
LDFVELVDEENASAITDDKPNAHENPDDAQIGSPVFSIGV